MSKAPTEEVFLLRKEELETIRNEIAGDRLRAEELVQDAYVGTLSVPRPALLYLLELVVTSEGYLGFLSSMMSPEKETIKDGFEAYRVVEKDLRIMANYSNVNRNVRRDLLGLGYTMELQ